MNKIKIILLLVGIASGIGMTSMSFIDVPKTNITNGLVKVELYLPDAKKGYYRGTRFDWSGVIPIVEYDGHNYHGKWFENYSPTNHDAIMGPVEEFDPIGYDNAQVGESFLKIGVGSLVKSKVSPYSPYELYAVSNPGKWKVKKQSDKVQFTHTLKDDRYSYVYEKTVKLIKGKPEMVLMHTLKNTGKQTIETSVYNHNFFVIDEQPAGPGYKIILPYENLSSEDGKGVGELVNLKGDQVLFLRDLTKKEQVYFPNLTNGNSVSYKMNVENIKTGAGVRVTGDRPISKLVFWSSSTNVSPEPYINVKVEPGQSFSWNISYEYYIHPLIGN